MQSEASAPATFLHNAPLSRADKSLVLSSAQPNLRIMEIVRQTRRPSGPMGGCGRRDIPYVAEDEEDVKSFSEEDDIAWRVAYCKAQRKLKKEGKGIQRGEGGNVRRHHGWWDME